MKAETRTKLVTVRLTEAEHEQVKKAAKLEKRTVADYIRLQAVDGHGRRDPGSSREGTGLASRVDPGLGNQGGRVREQPVVQDRPARSYSKEQSAGRKGKKK